MTVGLAYATVNATIVVALRNPHRREQEILTRYETIWSEARRFDAAKASNEEGQDFTAGALQELQPIVKELERSANVNEPIRQNLLVTGRENLLKIRYTNVNNPG